MDDLTDRSQRGIDRLLAVVARLRSDDGCPWDREQTIDSLKPFLIEECYEVIDAIDDGSPDDHAEELGDVLLQVALHARIREEAQQFSFDDVAHTIADKLIHRHPHVFGDTEAATSGEVVANWEKLKAAEKKGDTPRSALAGLPRHLPALQKAQGVQGRAARVGFDWDKVEDVLAKVHEELAETEDAMAHHDAAHFEEEIGDLLFAVVNLARFRKVDAEGALRATVAKFRRRFQGVEERIHAEGRHMSDCTLADMDKHWNAIKQEERQGESHPSDDA